MRLRFVTGNAGKVREAREALAAVGVEVVQANVGYPELQADDLATVARAGAEDVARRLDGPFFLDDAGLFVEALGGFPGVYSSYVYGTVGLEGILRLLEGETDRRARFEAVVAYRDPVGEVHLLEGVCRGTVPEARLDGAQGFGYDPIFVPKGEVRSFAQMPASEKNAMSHRGRALAALAELLSEQAAGSVSPDEQG